MKLYLFNPDADMALANNTEHYMAPAPARQMAQDLALLPLWYAPEGAGVLAPSAYNLDYLCRMRELLGLSVELITEPEVAELPSPDLSPWGWNPSLRRRLLRLGVGEECLPTPATLADYRILSGRDASLPLLQAFAEWPECCGEAVRIESEEACRAYAEKVRRAVFKAPWSGSGKGLCWCYEGFHAAAEGWCRRTLQEQGFVVASPIYDRVADFAMEFQSDGRGRVDYLGLSLFETNSKGAYLGNVLRSQERLPADLNARFSRPLLQRVRTHLQALLADFCGRKYAGCLGVDMMVCRSATDPDRLLLHPCVEVNLRMNMGVVACRLSERLLAPDSEGVFRVKFYPSTEELRREADELTALHPLRVADGRLRSGFLPLVPVTPRSRYLAYVLS